MLKKRDHVTIASDTLMPQPVTKTLPTQTAYLAGLFDGEGCVRVYKAPPRPDRGEINYQNLLWVTVWNHDPRIPTSFKKILGYGWVSREPRPKPRLVGWRYNVKCRCAEDLLKKMYPFLTAKKEEVKLAFILQTLKRIKRTKISSLELLEIEEKIRVKMQELKRREFKENTA